MRHSESMLTKLECLATDNEDNITALIRTPINNEMQQRWRQCSGKRVEQINGPEHYGVAVVEDELMV